MMRPVRFTVVIQSRHTLDVGVVSGRQIREKAGVPAGYALFRRVAGETEPIGDDDSVSVNDGDHFFAQPRSQPGGGHAEKR